MMNHSNLYYDYPNHYNYTYNNDYHNIYQNPVAVSSADSSPTTSSVATTPQSPPLPPPLLEPPTLFLIQFEPKLGREEPTAILGIFSTYELAFSSLSHYSPFLTPGVGRDGTSTWGNGRGILRITKREMKNMPTNPNLNTAIDTDNGTPSPPSLANSPPILPNIVFAAIESSSSILRVDLHANKKEAFTTCGEFLAQRTVVMKLIEGKKWMDEFGMGHVRGRSGGMFMKTDWHHWFVKVFRVDEVRQVRWN